MKQKRRLEILKEDIKRCQGEIQWLHERLTTLMETKAELEDEVNIASLPDKLLIKSGDDLIPFTRESGQVYVGKRSIVLSEYCPYADIEREFHRIRVTDATRTMLDVVADDEGDFEGTVEYTNGC